MMQNYIFSQKQAQYNMKWSNLKNRKKKLAIFFSGLPESEALQFLNYRYQLQEVKWISLCAKPQVLHVISGFSTNPWHVTNFTVFHLYSPPAASSKPTCKPCKHKNSFSLWAALTNNGLHLRTSILFIYEPFLFHDHVSLKYLWIQTTETAPWVLEL